MTGQEFSQQEQILLLLYFADDRQGTINNLKEMRGYLNYDEKQLKDMTNEVIRKLMQMTDEEYLQMDIWENM